VGAAPAGGVVLARFDSPGSARPLLVADPSPGVATAAELDRRRSLARALLANPTTTAGERAAAVLSAGAVDPRLLALLAALTAREGIGIADLPPAAGEPAPSADGVPARHALVDTLGGEPLTPGAAATDRLRTWLAAQQPPFAPDEVRTTGDGVLVGFRYVSDPDALVTRSAP
jgi:hypothetical protein